MIIPAGYSHIQHFFDGVGLPNGAAVTYGISGFGTEGPEEAASEMHTVFADRWLPVLSNNIRLVETRAKAGPNETGPFATWTEPLPGEGTGPVVPPNTCLLVEKRTELGGRSGRGRCYIPGLLEASVDDGGNINPGDLAGWNVLAQDWLDDIEAITLGMFLFHSASSDPTRVTNLAVDPVVATQRRRLR